jgi:Reverse transcriptase (RNA-dependent DNA polymerase)
MLNERHSVASSPSGISHRVAPDPDVIARDGPSGVVSLTSGESVRLSTNGTLRSKRSLTNMQQNVDPRGNATPPVPNRTVQYERNMNTGYNLRRSMITTATAQDNAERIKRYRATTHLASAIASGDQVTAYAVDDIKASLSQSESQGNKYDDKMRDDYMPPNRMMMLLCKQMDKWITAEEDTLRSFEVNNVMTKNPRLPDNGKALPLKWIYTVKKDLKGVIIRYEARLVVQGFFPIFGVDYSDTYSPVAKFVSIRIILALSVQLGLIIHTMDVNTAILNASLEENTWIQIPPGTKLATGDDGIYKLLKSLYGLKQASRC